MRYRIYYDMEILILVLLYYFSQDPNFAQSVQPIMAKLKDSEQMLSFLNNLSKFTQTFSTFASSQGEKEPCSSPSSPSPSPHSSSPSPQKDCSDEKENPSSSPTAGIADEFIQQILESYLKKR